MNSSKKTTVVVSVSVVLALLVGVFIGTKLNCKSSTVALGDGAQKHEDWSALSVEDLGSKLSEVMLPEEEFVKLEAAIFQTAMGLMMAQAQGAGITVNDEAQKELKESINQKYSRKYFADMNASSMKELSKEDLILILGFYHTTAGQKFLELSPKIIQTTMSAVQTDLSAWLPKTVDALVAKLKGGKEGAPEEKVEGKVDPKAEPKAGKPAQEAGADS